MATNITGNSGVSVAGREESAPSDSRMKMTTAQDAARQIIQGAEKAKFRVVIGSDAKMLDRLSRLTPRRATILIADKMKSLLAPVKVPADHADATVS
ncbi:hypothetical protein PU560_14010 [Georgenia sp. 10Sc9-8]|uniref:Uncharacterized protein n=1 Tax=Georgenia halotolerans TaxID=3028317 RepID=A0ABT5U051_9MICO|nr:hypothetical protein [Georgenia halotolerans]